MFKIHSSKIRTGATALGRRALGFGFLALALAPLLLVAAVLFVMVDTMANVVAVSRAKVTAVTEILDKELTPRIAAIESGYQDSVRGIENVGAQFTQVSRTLSNIPDITLQRGQLGETQPFPLRIPDGDVGLGLIHIGDGQLFNQTLPSLQLPAAAISIPTTPIRQALAPLGENGPIARAIADSSAQVGQAVDQVKRLGAPLSQLQSEVGAWFAPLRDFGQRVALLVEVTVAVLALLLVLYAAATIHVAVTRRREGAMAFQFGGPLGYLRFVHARLFLDGYSRLRGRNPAEASVPVASDASSAIARLDAEVRRLRDELDKLSTIRDQSDDATARVESSSSMLAVHGYAA